MRRMHHAARREMDRSLRSPDRAVLSSFERLWHSYQKLRYKISRSGDRQLQAELKPAAEAFTDLQQHVKQWYADADHALYGRGGYVLDPYYN